MSRQLEFSFGGNFAPRASYAGYTATLNGDRAAITHRSDPGTVIEEIPAEPKKLKNALVNWHRQIRGEFR